MRTIGTNVVMVLERVQADCKCFIRLVKSGSTGKKQGGEQTQLSLIDVS